MGHSSANNYASEAVNGQAPACMRVVHAETDMHASIQALTHMNSHT